jgi:hypothetical protein
MLAISFFGGVGGVGIAVRATIPGAMKFIFKNNPIQINPIHQSSTPCPLIKSQNSTTVMFTRNTCFEPRNVKEKNDQDHNSQSHRFWKRNACEAMVYVLKNKKSLARLIEKNQQTDIVQPITSSTMDSTTDLSHDICSILQQGKSIGAVWLLSRLANHLGITAALGDSREGRLALWQVLVITIDQGSRLFAAKRKELSQVDFDFMTALTKGQIEKLIRQNVIQLSFFDENISEIILKNGKRYLLKRNPVRAEISNNRRSK